jgi:uncharacterized protein YfaS (alpha-2-macroglobulin family)
MAGLATRDAAFWTALRVEPTSRYEVVRLRVALPDVVPALQGLVGLVEQGYFGPDPAASRVLGAAAVYRYLERTGRLDEARRRELRGWLSEIGVAMLMSQNQDGSWGWFWDPGGTPYVTGYALDALLELRDLGFPIPDPALRAAADYLLEALGEDGVYDMAEIAVWEGDDPRVRLAATAEVFDVLSRLPSSARDGGYDAQMRRLAERFSAYLDEPSPDPLTLAHALLGLSRVGSEPGLEGRLAAAAERLGRIRLDVHWEPGWFNAFGGTIEATAAALQVASLLHPDRFEAMRHDALRFLLSTRESWGGWHNARSTAYAIRALLLLNPAPEPETGNLAVLVDGQEVRRLELDGRDPFASSLALREIELEPLEPGEHMLEVRYSGRQRAQVQVEVETWPTRVGQAVATASPRLRIERSAPSELGLGQVGEVVLRVSAAGAVGPILVEQPLPPNATVERRTLDALVASGQAARYELSESSVLISVLPGETHELRFGIAGSTPGDAALQPAVARAALRPETVARSADSRLVVQ